MGSVLQRHTGGKQMDNDMLSIIVRTMPKREHYLNEALFGLVAQKYRPIEIIIVCQKLNYNDSCSINDLIKSFSNFSGVRFKVLEHVNSNDARAHSINLGLDAAEGRYIAFHDDDDVIYPTHYLNLIEAIKKSNYAWAYSDVVRAYFKDNGNENLVLTERSTPFKKVQYSFVEHLRDNFIPIHSFVIDKFKINKPLRFFEKLSLHEDYEFLLRLANDFQPIYISIPTCEYRIRGNNSNSVMDGMGNHNNAISIQKRRKWDEARAILEGKKRELIGWWISEIINVGYLPNQIITTQFPNTYNAIDMLTKMQNSRSWRLTRPIRNFKRLLKGLQSETEMVVYNGVEAARIIESMRCSVSWEITGPLRVAGRLARKLIRR